MKSEEHDPEKQPLLQEDSSSDDNDDSMSYDARKLVTLQVMAELRGTVWAKPTLWKMMGMLLLISIATATAVALLVRDPAKLDVSKFQQISMFLRVIVGLLISFFMASSVNRWYSCTNGFLELFDAIRGLQMQLDALGVPKERIHLCLRYCVLSARCLIDNLASAGMTPKERAQWELDRWDEITQDEVNSSEAWADPRKTLATVTKAERETLNTLVDPSQTLWVWVTSLLTRMSADGEIPPMPTPTYGRVIMIAEKAYNGIREVRASVSVQPPWVYVQMMAMLVGVNNIINAISFGMTLGVSLSCELIRFHLNPFTDKQPTSAQASAAIQDLGIAFIMCTLGPFLYQALLEVAVCIAQPFAAASAGANTPGRIPTDKLLAQLQKDLRDADVMSKNLPWWESPSFKPKA